MTKSETQEPIFDLSGVWHTFTGARPIDALRGVDLQIYPGEYVAIIGANGSGKSTLARHLNALLQPTRGRVRVAGLPADEEACKPEIRRRVQMVFQQPDYQIVATTVEEDVAFGPENFGVPEGELAGRVQTALQSVDLWEQRARPPHMLSAGQKQRVAIAGALAVQPQALVLDEATAMLDPAGRRALLELLRRLQAQGTTLVSITHEMEEAAEAGRIVVLDEGRVVLDGEPRAVFSQIERLRSLNLDVPWLAGLSVELGLAVCLTEEDFLDALGPAPDKQEHDTGEKLQAEGSHSSFEAGEALIQVQGLHHTYLRGTPLAAQALSGVTLEIRHGSLTGLIGPTGSGKSTLLQHLNGLLRPQAGHVLLDGQDWANANIDTQAMRQKVGLLFQQPEDQLFEQYVGDDVAFGPRQLKLGRGRGPAAGASGDGSGRAAVRGIQGSPTGNALRRRAAAGRSGGRAGAAAAGAGGGRAHCRARPGRQTTDPQHPARPAPSGRQPRAQLAPHARYRRAVRAGGGAARRAGSRRWSGAGNPGPCGSLEPDGHACPTRCAAGRASAG